jgi:hypothetical protein
MNQKLLALYGPNHNPFSHEIPSDALHVCAKTENFC